MSRRQSGHVSEGESYTYRDKGLGGDARTPPAMAAAAAAAAEASIGRVGGEGIPRPTICGHDPITRRRKQINNLIIMREFLGRIIISFFIN